MDICPTFQAFSRCIMERIFSAWSDNTSACIPCLCTWPGSNELEMVSERFTPYNIHICKYSTSEPMIQQSRRLIPSRQAEKAKYSSVKPKSVDYDTSFKDCQRLQIASEKLSVAQEVLSANSAIATLIHGHSTDFVQHSNENSINESSRDVFNRMESYLTRLHSFTLTAAALQRQARGIERLVIPFPEPVFSLISANTLRLVLQAITTAFIQNSIPAKRSCICFTHTHDSGP